MSPPPDHCRYCSGPRGEGYEKWWCSARCMGRQYVRGHRDIEWPCASCGRPLAWSTHLITTKRCELCRRPRRPALSAAELAERDGTTCGICGLDVDMKLGWPDLLSGTADHVIPRAHRGSDDPENLQLAHLSCNARKQDRVL